MKNLIILLSFLSLSSFVCKDKCKEVICKHGDCIDGWCNCSSGYGGLTCDSLNQVRAMGNYTGNANKGCNLSSFSNLPDTITVTPGTTNLDLNIKSKYLPELKAVIRQDPNFIINNQEYNGYSYSGIGQIGIAYRWVMIYITEINQATLDTCIYDVFSPKQ